MKRYVIVTVLIFIIAFLNESCKKQQAQKEMIAKKSAGLQLVVLSQDDSAKAISKGWTLSSKGMLIYWERHLDSGLFDEVPVKVDSQKILSVIDSLKQTGILRQKLKGSGNVVFHLRYKQGGQVTHISWTDSTPLPAAFLLWKAKTLKWCEKLKRQEQSSKN